MYGCIHGIWNLPGQRLNLSHNCSNSKYFRPLHGAGTWASIATWAPPVGFLTHCTTAGIPSLFLKWKKGTYSLCIQTPIATYSTQNEYNNNNNKSFSKLSCSEFQLWLSRLKTWLASMRMQIRSLVLLRELSIWHYHKLWHRSQIWLGFIVTVAVP